MSDVNRRLERLERRADAAEERWLEQAPRLSARIEHLELLVQGVAQRTERLEGRLAVQAAVSAGGAAGIVELIARFL